VKKRSSS
jgi:hypothetical protein